MDGSQFDDLLRSLTESRRTLLGGALAVLSGLLVVPGIDAKKKRKRKKRKRKKRAPKATPNGFGCLEINDPCPSDDDCCSGICEGKTCRAHDTGSCEQDQPGYCEVGNPELAVCIGSNGGNGVCFRTTAGSNACVNRSECTECQRDADCEALGYPPGSACAPVGGDLACADSCQEVGTSTVCVFFSTAERVDDKR